LVGLKAYNYFNFGLIYGEFEGILPPVEDLHQMFSALLQGGYLISVCNAVDEWRRTELQSWTYLNAALVGWKT